MFFCVACSGLSVVGLARKGKRGRKRGKGIPVQRLKKTQKRSRKGRKRGKGSPLRRLFQGFKRRQEKWVEVLKSKLKARSTHVGGGCDRVEIPLLRGSCCFNNLYYPRPAPALLQPQTSVSGIILVANN